MAYFIGIDGGGTKTEFLLTEESGHPAASAFRGGCSHMAIGMDAVIDLLKDGVSELMEKADIREEACAGCCIGLPCYGEHAGKDPVILKRITQTFLPMPVYLTNDVEVGWAGSLEGEPGIHIVAGTGAIAFARDSMGNCARCGGWPEQYGDEGSCYWVGRELLTMFTKQSDGRMPRGPLYEILRQKLQLEDDFEINDVLCRGNVRKEIAGMQRIALEAARAGDVQVQNLYVRAAEELAQLARTLKEKLEFPSGETRISYSGGLFHAGKFVLEPLQERVKALGGVLCRPRKTPAEGAALLAVRKFGPRT